MFGHKLYPFANKIAGFEKSVLRVLLLFFCSIRMVSVKKKLKLLFSSWFALKSPEPASDALRLDLNYELVLRSYWMS
jgi:hypothetical protein